MILLHYGITFYHLLLLLYFTRINIGKRTILEANSVKLLKQQVASKGAEPVYVQPIISNNGIDNFISIFEAKTWNNKPGERTIFRIGMSEARLKSEHKFHSRRGFVLHSLCGYKTTAARSVKFVAIWQKGHDNNGGVFGQLFHVRMSNRQYSKRLKTLQKFGYSPHSVCVYHKGKKAATRDYYAGIWHKSFGSAPHWFMAYSHLDGCLDKDTQHARDNYYPTVFQAYSKNGKNNNAAKASVPRCVAVWKKGYGNTYRIQIGTNLNRMTDELSSNTFANLLPVQAGKFEDKGQKKYFILWNGKKLNWQSNGDIPVSQVPGPTIPGLNRIDANVKNFMRKFQIPAFSFAIALRDSLQMARAYGFSDVRQRKQTLPMNSFRVVSVSKPLTSAAIFKLLQERKLRSLDAKIFGMRGILKMRYGTRMYNSVTQMITVRHLLEHTSGAWDNQLKLEFKQKRLNQDQFLSWIMDSHPPSHFPGSFHTYSNIGYIFLGRVIERLSGMSYEKFVQSRLLQPIGVFGAKIGNQRRDMKFPDEVTYYSNDNANPYFHWSPRRMDSAAGWVLTPVQMVTFLTRLNSGEFSGKVDLLSPALLMEMIRPSRARSTYAMGWQLKYFNHFYHYGSLAGSEAIMGRMNNGFTYAVCINMRGAIENQFTHKMSEIMAGIGQFMLGWQSNVDLFRLMIN